MRILAWNIMHGGGARTPEIALAILESRPDVVGLCEFRARRGGQLAAVLADHGLVHQFRAGKPGDEGRSNGLLLASRFRAEPARPIEDRSSLTALVHGLGPEPTTICLAHVPYSHTGRGPQQSARARAWRVIHDEARARRTHRHVVIGDLNCSRHHIDEAGSACRDPEQIGRLATMGYVDPWRAEAGPEARQHSWVGPRGERTRIDHALVSAPIAAAGARAAYHDSPMSIGISDHAALALDLAESQKH